MRMKSTVIRFLLTSKGDPRQSVRLRRFLLASATYAICLPLLLLAWVLGMIEREPALLVAAAMIAANLGFYAVFRSGLNMKFADPSLTRVQVLAAVTVLMFAVYSFDDGRAMVLNLALVVLTFGVFRFTTREFVRTALWILAGYALVINLLMYFKPATVNVYHEWFQWAGLAGLLPLFAMIGGRISRLRERLRSSNDELRSALGAVRQMATHDHLTGLPNRVLFGEELQRALARAERHSRPVTLFFMDLDRFKNINDTLGHQFGDRVLQEVSKRLAACVREGDIVARLGGDEFVLLVEELGTNCWLRWPIWALSTGRISTCRSRSASARIPPTGVTRRRCSPARTSPCTAPRITGGTASASTRPSCNRTRRRSSLWKRACATAWSATSSACTTSPRST
jgi:GGDEF domain-containing protein